VITRVMSALMPIPRSEDEVALYRFRDADDVLLYVGFSNQPIRRWYSSH
jgi:hypothetical protein